MHFVLTPGERHDTVGFGALVKGGKVKRQERGRPKHRSQYLVGDKAGASAIKFGNNCVEVALLLSSQSGVIRSEEEDSTGGCTLERNRVERLINRLKQCRRIATRP